MGKDLPPGYERIGPFGGGDVLGDGHADRAIIMADEQRPSECRYFLVLVPPGGGPYYAPIEPLEELPAPSLLFSKELDGEPGTDLVVEFGWPGYPHRAGQVFTFEPGPTFYDGSLVRMQLDSPQGWAFPWVFPLGGEDPAGVDCTTKSGTIVVTTGAFSDGGDDDGHYDITRILYRAQDTTFVQVEQDTHTVEAGTERERWPELADAPFMSCPDYLPGWTPP